MDAPATPVACARIAIDGSQDLEFDYRIPQELADRVAIGSRVTVPLRNRETKGTIIDFVDHDEPPRGLRDLTSLIHQRPILTPMLLKLLDAADNLSP